MLLKTEYNFPLESTLFNHSDKEIHFYLADGELYMNCGLDPINEDVRIRSENYERDSEITIKARDLGISLVHRLMSFEAATALNEDKDRGGAVDEAAEKSKCRRTKERRIGHIIDKVIEWRKYYSGTVNERNQPLKYSLEEAAKVVGISKKSLDDYLFQIRFGHRYGFNFNEHYNDKVGVLRDFVRQNKKNDKN